MVSINKEKIRSPSFSCYPTDSSLSELYCANSLPILSSVDLSNSIVMQSGESFCDTRFTDFFSDTLSFQFPISYVRINCQGLFKDLSGLEPVLRFLSSYCVLRHVQLMVCVRFEHRVSHVKLFPKAQQTSEMWPAQHKSQTFREAKKSVLTPPIVTKTGNR